MTSSRPSLQVGAYRRSVMQKINWKLIAFISALWWFIYSAPTEDSIATWLFGGSHSRTASYSDDF